jgi:serine protease
VRVLGKCGGFVSDVIAGMYWAAGLSIPSTFLNNATVPANPNPAQVINMSLGGTGPCSSVYANVVRDITAQGVLVVVSAGNEGEATDSPANCVGALGVEGVRHIGTKVGHSNLGSAVGIDATAGNCVNITPGSPCLFALNTTSNDGATTPGNPSYTTQLNGNIGTSFASPLVAGAAVLMKAVNPSLTPALLIARMKQSARAFPTTSDSAGVPNCVSPSLAPLQATECICNTTVCGAGMLDAGAAVAAAQRPIALASFTGNAAVGSTLSLIGSASTAAAGRMLASYGWTAPTLSGGATPPTIQSANQPVASVVLPAAGTYTFRLTVTDNIGATDFAEFTVTAAGGSNPPPPTTPPDSGGGGGGTAPGLLWLIGLLYLARTGKKWT